MLAKKMTRVLTTIVASVMLVLANIQTAPLAHADDASQHIAMTPSSAEISLKPGERKEGFVSVVNQGSGVFDVALSVAPYHVAPDDPSYEPNFDKLAGTTDPSPWVSLATTSSKDLQPNTLVDYGIISLLLPRQLRAGIMQWSLPRARQSMCRRVVS